MKRNYTFLIVAATVLVFYLWRYRRAPDLEPNAIIVSDESGNTTNLQSLLADSSIVICYASWCGPCLKELRSLKTNFTEYKGTGIHFYCITDDPEEKIQVMRDNMPSEISFLHTESLKEIGIYSIPASFFFVQNTLTDKRMDAIDWQQKSTILESFIIN